MYFPNDPSPHLQSPPSPPQRFDQKAIESNLRISVKRVEGFKAILEQNQDPEDLEREVAKYHKQFQEDGRRLDNNADQVLESLS